MIKAISFLSLLLFFSINAYCQNFTVSGKITDAETGEDLIAGNVYAENYKKALMSDENGFYTITVPMDSLILVFTYFGYQTQKQKIYVNKDIILNISLLPENTQVEEIIIEVDDNTKKQLESTQMSTVKITPKEAKLLPAFMGEVDLLKTLQLKPGVQSGGEGQSGLYVRGGGPDQNLIIFDHSPIYNANHLFGFFSVFNPDAVKDIELYKGGFPSQFGGRLSSVVDISMKEGDNTKFHCAGGIGVIASRLTLEGPIKKNKLSYLISARRTYFDVFTRMINKANKGKTDFNPIPNYHFTDFNAKLTWNLGENDKLTFSGYYGDDIFTFNQTNFNFKFNWGNAMATLRWYHLYNSKLSSNISLISTRYKYNIENKISDFSFTLGSNIKDYIGKADFNYYHSNKHNVKFGAQAIYHQFTVGRLKAGNVAGDVAFSSGQNLDASELGAYISDDYTLNVRWKFNAGLRLTGFINDNKFFKGIEPRFSGRYKVNEKISLKASYARMFQYIHLVANSGASLPTDIWYPSNKIVKPQRSDQIASGIFVSLLNDKFIFSDEVYYKLMKRQIDFRDGAQIFANPNLTQEFVFGKGWSYGNEIYLEKKKGKTTGWIGYTLSWTWRQFNSINNGEKFHARYDRRHDISVVIIHQLSKRVNLTVTWVYGSGNWISLPVGRFLLQDVAGAGTLVVPEYLQRNGFRMPSYHRLDLGLVWKFTPKWGESDLTFSIYNAYNRKNPYFIYFDEIRSSGIATRFAAKQVSLFPIIPSVTYNFKF